MGRLGYRQVPLGRFSLCTGLTGFSSQQPDACRVLLERPAWRWRMLRAKKVYLNDVWIGEASTWAEVCGLLKERRVAFAGKPGMAEGPNGFYINGHFVVSSAPPRKARDAD